MNIVRKIYWMMHVFPALTVASYQRTLIKGSNATIIPYERYIQLSFLENSFF